MHWFGTKITRDQLRSHRTSVAALLAANALPLLGVLLLGWSTFEIVALYWFENVVIGVINVLKMVTCTPDPDQVDLQKLIKSGDAVERQLAAKQAEALVENPWLAHGAKFFFVPFFIVHYGMFCLVHGVFVVVLLGGDGPFGDGPFAAGPRASLDSLLNFNLLVAAAALAGSHLYSFFKNYLAGGEFRRTMLPVLMVQPYGRIVVLHVAIVLGAFVTLMLGSPILLLAILVIGKTLLDLSLHLAQHQDATAAEPGLGDLDAPTTAPAGD